MNIRVAEARDALQLSELVGSLAHFYLEDRSKPLPQWFSDSISPSSFLTRIPSRDFHNLVYEDDGVIVGYISVKGGTHLYHLFVRESSQGRGISSLLWRQARAAILPQKCVTLRSSLNAVPVYAKWGFLKEGEAGHKDGIWFQSMRLQSVGST